MGSPKGDCPFLEPRNGKVDIRSVPAEKGKEISAKRTVHIYHLF